jgi:5-methylcytosine-specific restriction protein A
MAPRYKVCSFPGCPEFVSGSTRCEDHTVIRPDFRPSAAKRGYGPRWKKESKEFLLLHPTCAVVGCGKPSTDVDHIDNLGPLGSRGYDKSNWRQFCHGHHSAKTAATTHLNRRNAPK